MSFNLSHGGRRIERFIGAAVLALLGSAPASFASGGVLKLCTDDTCDGYFYNCGDVELGRYVTRYDPSAFESDAIICGARLRTFSTAPSPDTLLVDCRFEDPSCPGYADLTDAGLLANADAVSLVSCSTTGAPHTATFGGGAGIVHPDVVIYATASQTIPGPAPEEACGLLLDTSSPSTGCARCQSVAPGGFKSAPGYNHFLEKIVFEPPRPIELKKKITGSFRFPGDNGIPLVFARRKCNPATDSRCMVANDGCTVDDYITGKFVFCNNTKFPIQTNFCIVACRGVINPKLTPKDVTSFFRPIGGGPPLSNPLVIPPGRKSFCLEIKTAINSRFLPLFPICLPFKCRLKDPNDPNVVIQEKIAKIGIQPNVGYCDSDTPDLFTTTRPLVLTGDALCVKKCAVDLPKLKNCWNIHGVQIVGGEFGASGLLGIQRVEIRTDDPIDKCNPDLSPQGLLRSTGPVAFGPPRRRSTSTSPISSLRRFCRTRLPTYGFVPS